MSNLPPLPASNHRFWKGAKNIKIDNSEYKKCKHKFKRMSGREVCCILCNIGFVADGSLKIENGKLVV